MLAARIRMRFQLVGFLAAALIASALVWPQASAQQVERYKDLNELYDVAELLESASMQVTVGNEKNIIAKREPKTYSFARADKTGACESHYKHLKQVLEDYRKHAYKYVADCNKEPNWLTGFMKMVSGHLGGMKNLARFDKNLAAMTERYELQGRERGALSEKDVDCDLDKVYIRALAKMMFVLKTDVKYLVVEDTQMTNIAIYRQLCEEKFIANSNFFKHGELTPRQRQLLFDFYTAHVDTEQTTIKKALGHFDNPGNLIIGRLLDSCSKISGYRTIWNELETKRAEECAQSKSDPANEQFKDQFNPSKYDGIVNFCRQFME